MRPEEQNQDIFDNLKFGDRVVLTQELANSEAGVTGVVIREHDSDHEVRIALSDDNIRWISKQRFDKYFSLAEGTKSFPHKYATRIASDQSPDGLILVADSIEALESAFQDLHPGHGGLDPTKIKHAVVEGDRATQTLEVKYREPGEKCATEVRNGRTQRDGEGEICSHIEQPTPAPAASLFTDLGNLPLIPLHRR